MGQGREAASLLATSLHHQHTLLPGLPGLLGLLTADCTPPGLADGPDLHPLQFQLMVWALPCSEDFSTAGGAECWSELTGGLSCSVQLSQSVVLDEKLRVWQ